MPFLICFLEKLDRNETQTTRSSSNLSQLLKPVCAEDLPQELLGLGCLQVPCEGRRAVVNKQPTTSHTAQLHFTSSGLFWVSGMENFRLLGPSIPHSRVRDNQGGLFPGWELKLWCTSTAPCLHRVSRETPFERFKTRLKSLSKLFSSGTQLARSVRAERWANVSLNTLQTLKESPFFPPPKLHITPSRLLWKDRPYPAISCLCLKSCFGQ